MRRARAGAVKVSQRRFGRPEGRSENIMSTSTEVIEQLANTEYKYGFITDVEQEIVPKGLSEDVIRLISAKKEEPEWLLAWRLKSYRAWLKMTEPTWQNVKYEPIDYQNISYYA